MNWPFFITAWALAALLTFAFAPAYGVAVLAVLIVLEVISA